VAIITLLLSESTAFVFLAEDALAMV